MTDDMENTRMNIYIVIWQSDHSHNHSLYFNTLDEAKTFVKYQCWAGSDIGSEFDAETILWEEGIAEQENRNWIAIAPYFYGNDYYEIQELTLNTHDWSKTP